MLFGSKDIARILGEWPYDPSKVNVRRIIGADGREKVQLRLDLGILQMETSGRPDGTRPYGKESLLEYYLDLLQNYRLKHGTDAGFRLEHDDCLKLQQEAIQYYHRYLSLFHLGDYEGALRDTQRNLRVFDLIKQYAANEEDKGVFEQFRPYVLMMSTRAKASIELQRQTYQAALKAIKEGIAQIEQFLLENEQGALIDANSELTFLRRWAEEIREKRPLTLQERLQRDLEEAVRREEFERAAHLRDQLRQLEAKEPRIRV